MKKVFLVISTLLLALTLVACKDKPVTDRDIVVIFYTNGGTNIDRIVNPEIGSKVSKPTDPTKSGYDFQGWYKSVEFTQIWDFNVDTIQKSTTIYANFTPVKYTIDYVFGHGEANNSANPESYTIERDVFLRDAVLDGYTFNGWYKDQDFKNKVTKIDKGSIGNVTLYSRMAFKLEFDATYLAVPRVILADPNEELADTAAIKTILNPIRTGYTFGGWYSVDTRQANKDQVKPSDEFLVSFDNLVITKEQKVYAYWVIN